MASQTVGRRHSTSSHESGESRETYDSLSTAPSSINPSPRTVPAQELKGSWSRPPPQQQQQQSTTTTASSEVEDISPSTSLCPRDSVDSYDSRIESEEDLGAENEYRYDEDEDDGATADGSCGDDSGRHCGRVAGFPRITALRPYLRQPEQDVIPSNPQTFARLFPSMDRLSIRHDDMTADGNMNLRVDTVISGGGSRRRPSSTIQLFHLRMYDLARREFSLRRYCRDSGREVCKARRKFADDDLPACAAAAAPAAPAATDATGTPERRRPSITRSVSSALRVLAPRPRLRSRSSGSGAGLSARDRAYTTSSYEADDEAVLSSSTLHMPQKRRQAQQPARPQPTNTIKLEFSNYARVDVTRRGVRGAGAAKRYEFDWWGHTYTWKRVVDPNVEGVVSFHLIRDGQGAAIAHIVPETRSPTQILEEEGAGGWVPPCYMWISDPTIIDAVTDVADVIVATGLMALVDDCIKEHWKEEEAGETKVRRASAFETLESGGPKALMQHFFRRHSEHSPSPLRVVASTY